MKKFILSFIALLSIGLAYSYADYTMTQGAGTTFGSKIVSLIHYGQQLVCDATAPATQCAAVSAGGALKVDNSAVNQPVVGPAASGAALSGNPVRVGMSDGTNAQNWLSAIALGDGVNGNNTGAVAGWMWNGATYDRIRGSATNGLSMDCGASSNTLCGLINSPPPVNVNGVNQALTGLTPGVAQTGTKYALNADLSSLAGTATSVNSGNKDNGTLRVVIATDQPSGTNAQPSNFVAYGGSAVGVSNPVFTQNSDGTNTQLIDPCQSVAKTYTPININTATTTRIIAPTSAKKTYICSLFLYPAGTTNIGIVEGTGGTCGTGTAGVIGGTTAATGINATATASFTLGNGGFAAAATAGTNVDFCLITSAAIQVSGVVAWVAR